MPHRSICVFGLVLLAALSSAGAEFRISGPYTHENLTVYLLHGESRAGSRPLLTLREAMEQNKVIVYETGTVNQLSIENRSSEEIYIQGGDIVKGGRQDRVLVTDMVLPPRSGKVPIGSFCVEQGRWRKRGAEADQTFNASSQVVAGKGLKLAVKDKKQQAEVWREVSAAQARLGFGAGSGGGGAADGVLGGVVGSASATLASPSSMQLTLEAKPVVDAIRAYLDALEPLVASQPDVVGFAYAINGALDSADAYFSHDLFARMWPKLLQASAVEALAARPRWKPDAPAASLAGVEKMISAAVPHASARNEDAVVLFETRDREQPALLLHRNYQVK
jgi:hypothetical protein